MTAPTRPGGRTVTARRMVSQEELKRTAVHSFNLGMRIAERRSGPDRYWEGYQAGVEDMTGAPWRDLFADDDADDLMSLADGLFDDSPMRPFDVDDWQWLLEQGIDPGGQR